MRRRNVRAFIQADPFGVEFMRRPEPEKTAAGGYKATSSPAAIPQQTVRIVHNTRRYKNGLVNAEAGEIPQTDYLLLGFHTLDVEVSDTFVWLSPLQGAEPGNYKITGIHPFRFESTLCSLEFDGPDNRG
jgi:hypothetical protein